ncbi:MAG: carbohydrate binding family 9 domain-containing protein [Bacteroidales bacterium]|nr:carbohydrate binding family 9 domain-containing protein [Bacteroidales bacterium]
MFAQFELFSVSPSDTLKYNWNNPRKYHTSRLTTEKPVIDGILDDECWKTGNWSGDFTQWIPREGAKPSQPTELKILYDNKNIYIAIRAFDSVPEQINRRAGRRDEFSGDVVGVNFDSYHDHRTGFEFNITAAGQKVDLLLSNPMRADFNWNAVWLAKTALEDSVMDC